MKTQFITLISLVGGYDTVVTSAIYVNPQGIERMWRAAYANTTTIYLTSGKELVVTETPEQIIELIKEVK